jgi:aspartate aminotransferase-like enzyme
LHETSTGQLYDIKMISKFCKKNNMYLIVDAISTFLCDEYHMDENDIDVTIISSQKGLCVAPGMSMVAINSRILKERVMNNNVSLYILILITILVI